MSADGTTQTVTWIQSLNPGWSEPAWVHVITSTDFGATWSTVQTLSEVGKGVDDHPQVAMSADGTTQTITWSRSDGANDGVQVTTSTDSGTTWSLVETLSEAGQDAGSQQMAMSADGTTQTITWSRSNGANNLIQARNSTDSGATWSPAETMPDTGQDAFDPQVAISADGTTQTITWRRSDGANYRIQVTTSTNSGATWSPAENVSQADTSAFDSQVAMSADGTTQTVTWMGYFYAEQIVVSRSSDSGSTWSPVEIPSGTRVNYKPQIAMSGDGTTQAITWILDIPGDGNNTKQVQVTIGDFSSVPSAPSAPIATPGNGEVSLSWTAPDDDGGRTVTGYTVSTSPGTATCSTASTSCVVAELANGTEYTFTVVATNTAGDSEASTPVSATPSMVRSVEEIGVDCTVAQPHPFTDVDETSFAANSIGCIYTLGVTTGTSPDTYTPHAPVTRQQMAAFLERLYEKVTGLPCTGEHPFTDVADPHLAADSIGCIYTLGVTTGTSSDTYTPHAPVTRQQMAAFLERLYNTLTN